MPRGVKSMLDEFGFGGERHWELIVTASVITTVPMIVVLFLGQRHFMQWIATTGSRG
jgi:multiple sugar transport system permease protein